MAGFGHNEIHIRIARECISRCGERRRVGVGNIHGFERLGNDPKSGKPVSVKITRFAPAVQLGNAGDKPRFASLSADQSMQTITMEEALMLFESPRSSVPKVRAHGALFPCFA